MLEDYQREFLDFALSQGALKFGEFTLKSGRKSPYFFNAGEFCTGAALARLGVYYAKAIVQSGISFDCLFGPAYKGIPLASATAIALASRYERDIPYVFNRKEAKNHGEGGMLVGAPLEGDVVIIDDVITAGTAIREVMGFFEGAQATPRAVVVVIDRLEKGQGEISAIQEVEKDFGLTVISVINLDSIVEYLEEKGNYLTEIEQIRDYRDRFGIASAI